MRHMTTVRPRIELAPWDQRWGGQGLKVEGRPLKDFYLETPFFTTALGAVAQRLKTYQRALKHWHPWGQIFYALKANGAAPILQVVHSLGAGLDLVSIGEVRAALGARFHPKDLCYAGVGKKPLHMKEALAKGVGWIVVEHLDGELDLLLDLMAQDFQYPTRLAIRVNPCVDSPTHSHLKTGALDSKFGVLLEDLSQWLEAKAAQKGSRLAAWLSPVQGIHVHVGSQLMDPGPFCAVVGTVLEAAAVLESRGSSICHLDFGGGLGVGVGGVPPGDTDIVERVDLICGELSRQLAQGVHRWSPRAPLSVCLEPGRSVVASSTVLLTQVLYARIQGGVQVVYVDAGMNDFPRPSLYGASHTVEWVDGPRGTLGPAHWLPSKVVGPVCESADVLAQSVLLPPMGPHTGHTLAFFEAGAYCRSMASLYNLRPFAEQVFLGDE